LPLVSFNPYFTGSTTSTITDNIRNELQRGFNPYFTGSTTSTQMSDSLFGGIEEFQSLFYWKYHFNCFEGSSHLHQNSVSILILLEVPLQQLRNKNLSEPNSEFQSLFYWKYHFNCTIEAFKLPVLTGFNPYFTGSTTSTPVLRPLNSCGI